MTEWQQLEASPAHSSASCRSLTPPHTKLRELRWSLWAHVQGKALLWCSGELPHTPLCTTSGMAQLP